MPAAPLAKGLIISLSVLFAAGLAVYENPQVRQWVDSSRRKIAIALHSLGDEFAPPSNFQSSSPDASTREDDSPEAVVRRWKARQEILERGRMMEERRKSKQDSTTANARSFDDMVDKDGALKREAEAAARTTAAEPQAEAEASGLHKRNTEVAGAALDSTLANPIANDTHTDVYPAASANVPNHSSRSSTATLPAADSPPPVPPKLPLHPPQPHPQPRLLIDTDDTSTHPSEQLIDLTPTTSASSAPADLETHPPSNYWSVHEWAENTAPSFYSPPQSEAGSRHENSSQGSGVHASRAGSESDLDVVSEVGEGVRTPGSWTEVGSVVSEEY